VGSRTGLSSFAMSLRTKLVNLNCSAEYTGHILIALPSLASAGDEFASQNFSTLILTIVDEEESTLTPRAQAKLFLILSTAMEKW
jgi:hypothetical protein